MEVSKSLLSPVTRLQQCDSLGQKLECCAMAVVDIVVWSEWVWGCTTVHACINTSIWLGWAGLGVWDTSSRNNGHRRTRSKP